MAVHTLCQVLNLRLMHRWTTALLTELFWLLDNSLLLPCSNILLIPAGSSSTPWLPIHASPILPDYYVIKFLLLLHPAFNCQLFVYWPGLSSTTPLPEPFCLIARLCTEPGFHWPFLLLFPVWTVFLCATGFLFSLRTVTLMLAPTV